VTIPNLNPKALADDASARVPNDVLVKEALEVEQQIAIAAQENIAANAALASSSLRRRVDPRDQAAAAVVAAAAAAQA